MTRRDSMNFPRVSPLRRHRAGRRGSILLELLLFLLVVVLGGTLLFSVVHRVRHEAKCRAWEKQLQEFTTVFIEYRARHGDWPATASEVGSRLIDLGWNSGSPFGGEYGWKPSGVPGQAGSISLTAFHPQYPLTLTAADLLEVDRRLDDGEPTTGRLHAGFNGWPVFQVAK